MNIRYILRFVHFMKRKCAGVKYLFINFYDWLIKNITKFLSLLKIKKSFPAQKSMCAHKELTLTTTQFSQYHAFND